jgi:hypothetical protein
MLMSLPRLNSIQHGRESLLHDSDTISAGYSYETLRPIVSIILVSRYYVSAFVQLRRPCASHQFGQIRINQSQQLRYGSLWQT